MALRKKKMEDKSTIRTRRRTQRRIIFMGDGTFSHSRKHAPVPKKQVVKTLAVRGPVVLLDEYNTSKMCPCGTSELQDKPSTDNDIHRLRCHKVCGQGGPCCVESVLTPAKMDRDVLATINFLLCAGCAVGGRERPEHLCGPWRFR